MNPNQFAIPVRVVPRTGEPVMEIFDVEEAMAFLVSRPDGDHDLERQNAVDACFAVTLGIGPIEAARWMLLRYARDIGIVSRDTPAEAFLGHRTSSAASVPAGNTARQSFKRH